MMGDPIFPGVDMENWSIKQEPRAASRKKGVFFKKYRILQENLPFPVAAAPAALVSPVTCAPITKF